MGSPLGPTLANFFFANLENISLNNTDSFYPKIYLRYVDDIFAIFNDSLLIKKFMNLLNKQCSLPWKNQCRRSRFWMFMSKVEKMN